MNQDNTYLAGFGERDITAIEFGIQLMGWGVNENVANGIADRLFARCVAMHEPESATNFIYACVDVCIMTHHLREQVVAAVLEEIDPALGVADDQIMLTATHTHSAPSGISDYFFYCLSGPGFSKPIFDTFVAGISSAILDAASSLQPVVVRPGSAQIPLSSPIAFNRSLVAYRRNPEADSSARPDEAVNRTMQLLRFETTSGAPLGALTFFGTHCTTVHSDHQVIHPDHKGLAANQFRTAMEQRGAPAEFQAIFAQEAAGDVTPNYRYSRARGFKIGHLDDDFENAAFVASKQVEAALEAWDNAGTADPLAVKPLYARLDQVDFVDLPVDEAFSHTEDAYTSSPVVGVGFMEGTEEGPGPLLSVARVFRVLSRGLDGVQKLLNRLSSRSLDQQFRHRNKLIGFETGRGLKGKVFGILAVDQPLLPGALDHVVKRHLYFLSNNAVGDGSWTPRVTSTHLARIGDFFIVGLSGEPTTVAAQRLRQTLRESIGDDRCTVVINGYANSYNGYITTPEEYDAQEYEGASTHYGRFTLPAHQMILTRASRAMSEDPTHVNSRRDQRDRTKPEVLERRFHSTAVAAGIK